MVHARVDQLPDLSRASRWALFLDIDGTIADIAPTPDAACVPASTVAAVIGLHRRLSGALAILTGRTIVDADRLLAPAKLPIAGVHGAQYRTNGEAGITELGPVLPEPLRRAVKALGARHDGLIIEDKGAAMSVHFRLVPSLEAALAVELSAIVAETGHEFVASPGRKLFEVRAVGHSKAGALSQFLEFPDFRRRVPIVIGDDAFDERAIDQAERLDGVGLRVGGEYFTRAGSSFASPGEVRAWLEQSWGG